MKQLKNLLIFCTWTWQSKASRANLKVSDVRRLAKSGDAATQKESRGRNGGARKGGSHAARPDVYTPVQYSYNTTVLYSG